MPGLTLPKVARTMTRTVADPTRPKPPAAYRNDPMPETALDILTRIGAMLDARDAERVRTSLPTRAELRTKPLIDLSAYRGARA